MRGRGAGGITSALGGGGVGLVQQGVEQPLIRSANSITNNISLLIYSPFGSKPYFLALYYELDER